MTPQLVCCYWRINVVYRLTVDRVEAVNFLNSVNYIYRSADSGDLFKKILSTSGFEPVLLFVKKQASDSVCFELIGHRQQQSPGMFSIR